jgi:sarcosine oxidase subunit beta
LNIRIALESIARFARFSDEIGADIGFRQCGYLFLLEAPDLARFRETVALQRSLGVPVEILTVDEALAYVPGTSPDGLAAATFCPIDGLATPDAVVQGYAAAARRHGARIMQGTAVREITVERGRVTGVHTERGGIATERVVLVAGVWSRDLARTAGLDLPVTPERRYVYYVDQPGTLPASTPLTIDFATGFYFHREGAGLILGGPWSTAEELAPVAIARLPMVADLGIAGGWSGLYEMSPDHNAMVGACDEPAGLLYATGFSGHGFQQAPVVGEYLADLVLGHLPSTVSDPSGRLTARSAPLRPLAALFADLGDLSLRRFTQQKPRPEANIV